MIPPPRSLKEKWLALAEQQMQWSRESDAKGDGANSHTERARARIYRECAADLDALLASSSQTVEELRQRILKRVAMTAIRIDSDLEAFEAAVRADALLLAVREPRGQNEEKNEENDASAALLPVDPSASLSDSQPLPNNGTETIAELYAIARFIRTPGNISRDDAIDDCARVLENRANDLAQMFLEARK